MSDYLKRLEKLNPALAALFADYERRKEERERLAECLLFNAAAIRALEAGEIVRGTYMIDLGGES